MSPSSTAEAVGRRTAPERSADRLVPWWADCAAGYDQASLGVDADSLTGAVRLYENVGFTVALTWTVYRKRLA